MLCDILVYFLDMKPRVFFSHSVDTTLLVNK